MEKDRGFVIYPSYETWESATPVDADQIKELDFLLFHSPNPSFEFGADGFALFLVVKLEEQARKNLQDEYKLLYPLYIK